MSEVIYYTSNEAGAPALTPDPGSIVGILDACLVNGFNAKTVISATVASSVMTLSVSAHGYTKGRKVLIGGLAAAGTTGVFKILSVPDTNSLTVAVPGVADGSAGGSGTIKRAPLGWTKTFGDTTSGVYTRPDGAATAYKFRIVDTNAASSYWARASGVLNPTSVAASDEQFPASKYITDGTPQIFIPRAQNVITSVITWMVVGDGRSFYLLTIGAQTATNGLLVATGFGDLISLKPSDSGAAFMGGMRGWYQPNFLAGSTSNYARLDFSGGSGFVARDYGGFGLSPVAINMGRGAYPMGGQFAPLFPSPVNNGMLFEKRTIVLEDNAALGPTPRGFFPGVGEPLFQAPLSMQGSVLPAEGRDWLVACTAFNGSNVVPGTALFDVTGPWQ